MRASAAANRRTLWLLFAVAVSIFAGSILFIVSRMH
jgi:hypothetical protein